MELVAGHPRPSLSGTGVPWVSLLGPTGVPTLLCVVAGVGVVTSCVPCARVRGRVSRSCATENTYTLLELAALFKLSVVTILSHSYYFNHNFCGLWVFSPTRLHVRHLIELFLFAACSVAIHLVHVNANLFLSLKIDQLRCTLFHFGVLLQSPRRETRCTLYFVCQ